LILKSTNDKIIFPYHSKIIKKINTLYEKIHPNFKAANPILSGSYLITLTVSPHAFYQDYDFYFSNNHVIITDFLVLLL